MKDRNLVYQYSFVFMFVVFAFLCGGNAEASYITQTKIDKIDTVKNLAKQDGSYENGLKWLIDITVPDNEPTLQIKFNNLISGKNIIDVKNTLKYYSEEFINMNIPLLVKESEVYGDRIDIDLNKDLDKEKPGRQIRIIAESSIPTNVEPGDYSLNFSLKTFDDIKPVIVLNSFPSVNMERLAKYEDEGATVIDNQGIPIKVQIDYGLLNMAIPGEYKIKLSARDIAGNMADDVYRIVKVIDTIRPEITLNNYIKTPTNKDITVTATTNEGTLNTTSHTFTENGSFDFIAIDDSGNKTISRVVIDNIDKEAPVISYIGANPFIIQRAQAFILDKAIATDNVSKNIEVVVSHSINIFKVSEGQIKYNARDEAGNEAAEVVRNYKIIDTVPPIITINGFDSTKTPTNKDVTITATVNEGTLTTNKHTFTNNGKWTFNAVDEVGNTSSTTVDISYIDKEAPIVTLKGSERMDIERGQVFIDPGINISDNHKEWGYSYSASPDDFDTSVNGFVQKIIYTATDKAGNSASTTRTVTVVDTKAPVITLNYSTNKPTNNDVIVTASISEEGTLNEPSKTFIENGEFEFIAIDKYGNESKLKAIVNNIDKIKPVISTVNSDDYIVEVGGLLSSHLVFATDNIDLNPNIIDDSNTSLNLNKVGNYIVSYYAVDNASNVSDIITKNIKVIEKTIITPTLLVDPLKDQITE